MKNAPIPSPLMMQNTSEEVYAKRHGKHECEEQKARRAEIERWLLDHRETSTNARSNSADTHRLTNGSSEQTRARAKKADKTKRASSTNSTKNRTKQLQLAAHSSDANDATNPLNQGAGCTAADPERVTSLLPNADDDNTRTIHSFSCVNYSLLYLCARCCEFYIFWRELLESRSSTLKAELKNR